MSELTFQGPFLTRNQAADRAHVPRDVLPDRPDLLRVGGEFLEEVYFAFQFDDHGVRPDIGQVVAYLKRHHRDDVIADWLVRSNAALNGTAPLLAINGLHGLERVLAASRIEGPQEEKEAVATGRPTRPPAAQIRPERRDRVAPRRRTAFPHPA